MSLETQLEAYEEFAREGKFKNADPDTVRNVLLYALSLSSGDSGGSETSPSPPVFPTVNNTTFAELSVENLTRQSLLLTNRSETLRLKVNFVSDVTQSNWIYNLKPLQTLEMSKTSHPRIIYSRITILAASGTCEYSFLEG